MKHVCLLYTRHHVLQKVKCAKKRTGTWPIHRINELLGPEQLMIYYCVPHKPQTLFYYFQPKLYLKPEVPNLEENSGGV